MSRFYFSLRFVSIGLVLMFAILNGSRAFAQETLAATPTPTPTPIIVTYDLAFPGLLPDSPFYKLKVFRDKLSEALIVDPEKKIEFYLLQTDKGILASAMLVDKGKIDLADQTAFKAENNYTLLTYQLSFLRKRLDKAYIDKLKTASLKHQEVLSSLLKRIPKDKEKDFVRVINFAKTNYQTIDKYENSE